MDSDNDKWLNALANKEKMDSENVDLNMAQNFGVNLRENIEYPEINEQGLSDLIQQLETEKLLGKNKKVFTSQYWKFAMAAAFACVISIPVILLQNPVTDYEDPVTRSYVGTQKVIVVNPRESAIQLQKSLKAAGYESEIIKHKGNFVLAFNVKKVSTQLQQIFGPYNQPIDKKGMVYIEFIDANK